MKAQDMDEFAYLCAIAADPFNDVTYTIPFTFKVTSALNSSSVIKVTTLTKVILTKSLKQHVRKNMRSRRLT